MDRGSVPRFTGVVPDRHPDGFDVVVGDLDEHCVRRSSTSRRTIRRVVTVATGDSCLVADEAGHGRPEPLGHHVDGSA
jgi:hypothetical protein